MPKQNPLERSLLASTISKLNAMRWQDRTLAFRKRHGSSMGYAGDPDLYGVWAGVPWELELKALGEQPTELQRVRHIEWSMAGAIVGVADSPAAVDAFLSNLETFVQARLTPPARRTSLVP